MNATPTSPSADAAKRPWYRKKRFMIPLAFVVFFVVVAALSGPAEDTDVDVAAPETTEAPEVTEPSDGEAGGEAEPLTSSLNTEHPPAEDVTIVSCEAPDDEFGFPEVVVEITNHSPKPSDYYIEVQLQDAAGTVVGEAIASVSNLRPGQTAREEAGSLDDIDGEMSCHLNSVDRFSAVG